MPELVASFTLTEQEFIRAWRRLQIRRWRAWLCPLIGVVIILESLGTGATVALALGWFLLIWSTWSMLSYTPRCLWRRLPALSAPQTITLRASGVEEQMASVRTILDWNHWTHVVRVDSAWVLRSPGGYTIIPSRALVGPDADSTLRQLAGTRLCTHRWLPF